MKDKKYRLIVDELIDGFANQEYQRMFPNFYTGSDDMKIKLLYQTDAIFKARVDNIVAFVMTTVTKHEG